MKLKYIYLLIIVVMGSITSSCGKFLEESSKDEITPRRVVDYKELIYGEIYNKLNTVQSHIWLDVMTDDCEEFAKKANLGVDTRGSAYGYFTWQRDPELQQSGILSNDNAWGIYYHHILTANMILYDLDDKEGTVSEREQVRAEAHMIRAYAYYMLVNLYGEPYVPETVESAKGVPLNNLVGAQNVKFNRVSVAENYRVIKEDITEALTAFDKANEHNTIFRWNKNAALVFAARVSVYSHDWDNAIDYCDRAIRLKSTLWNLNEKKTQGTVSGNLFFFNRRNPEILFSYGNYYINFFASGAKGAYPVSASLKAIYPTGDLRYGNTDGAYIRNLGSTLFGGGKRYLQYKYASMDDTEIFGFSIRSAEAYLLRAEAYAAKNEGQKAIDDLNTLRRNRLTPATYKEYKETDINVITQLVRTERRREMCFEQLRWFDLRRWDRPSITHKYSPNFNDLTVINTYVLDKDDPAYTLPIPNSIFIQDSDLENIDRKDRVPVVQ